MEIILTKGKNKNTLTCKREDGTFTSENLGPNFPHHDLAHYVVEKNFAMHQGFYRNIKSGMSIAELNDGQTINNLGPESLLSEVLTRNLQGLNSGAAHTEQFIELVRWEVENMDGVQVPEMELSDVENMKSAFEQLCEEWNSLSEHGELRLHF